MSDSTFGAKLGFVQRVTLHVPEVLNDGTPVGSRTFEAIEDQLLGVAAAARRASGIGEEGFTVLSGAFGVWRSPTGRIYRERQRLFLLDVPDVGRVFEQVVALADWVRTDLDQESVYVTVVELEAIAIFVPEVSLVAATEVGA